MAAGPPSESRWKVRSWPGFGGISPHECSLISKTTGCPLLPSPSRMNTSWNMPDLCTLTHGRRRTRPLRDPVPGSGTIKRRTRNLLEGLGYWTQKRLHIRGVAVGRLPGQSSRGVAPNCLQGLYFPIHFCHRCQSRDVFYRDESDRSWWFGEVGGDASRDEALTCFHFLT